jgi:inorganic triphosphatase YgiF
VSDSVPTEVEAKLLVPDDESWHSIARLARLGVYGLQPRDVVRLYSVYLDTPELSLTRYGAALRLRRESGRWEVTAKWGGEINGEIHERKELTEPLARRPRFPFALPAGHLRTHLGALVAGRELHPVLVTDIRRQRVDVVRGDGSSPEVLAELALDQVELRKPDAPEPALTYHEVEIEQRHGQRSDVHEIARLLARGLRLRPSLESKLARGMKLLYGAELLDDAPVRLLPGDTVAVAVRKVVDRHLRRIRLHDPGTRIGEDPEALHDQRVAVRRLRALVRVFPGGFATRTRQHFEHELRWLGDTLGSVRDLDVQVAQQAKDTAAAPPGHRRGYEGYRRYLREERERRRLAMLRELDSNRYFDLLVQLERFARSRPRALRSATDDEMQRSIAAAGREALKLAFRRLIKRGDRVHATPSPEDLHALRIRAKRARYLLEFLADLTGKPGARLVRRLVNLQDLLGSYHDNVVAADTVRSYVEGPGSDQSPASLLSLGALVSQHLQSAETHRLRFERAWKKFTKKRNLYLLRRVLASLKRDARRAMPSRPASVSLPARAAGRAKSAVAA